jgi:protein-L-isoaspartate(D-aspartate) O-methyltransferase
MKRTDERGADDLAGAREDMLSSLIARGITNERVLDAMAAVPREAFIPSALREFAYLDSPLPIAQSQTISQPYIVASMVEALEVGPDEVVLDVGTGSGYAAAVLAQLARRVFTIERHEVLADQAREVLGRLGYDNVEVLHGDGTLGWPEEAPFDRIVVAAAGPKVPAPLLEQLKVGGRLIVPVGQPREQVLQRITREGDREWREEPLGAVRFVPLIGDEGFAEKSKPAPHARAGLRSEAISMRLQPRVEPIEDIEDGDIEALVGRLKDARVVLLGEATHGTSEFYRMRARITRELVERAGFRLVALEADWPDARRIDDYVTHRRRRAQEDWTAFARFPTWMWRNEEVLDFVEGLRRHNRGRGRDRPVSVLGLDIYSLYTSIGAVLRYLDDLDPEAAAVARQRYGCLSPWEADPIAYAQAARIEGFATCEDEVVAVLEQLLERRMSYIYQDGARFLDALQNARLVANAERYYRSLYLGGPGSWNLRVQHMFDTLLVSLEMAGPGSKAVIWGHNSHVGDATATEMGARGEHNVGELCRRHFGADCVRLVGFGTHSGTVAAASSWDGPMEVKRVLPSRADSYEFLCHSVKSSAFVLPLRDAAVRDALPSTALERAIGVIYLPKTEIYSHYFQAALPRQFDEYIWFDETKAVRPLPTEPLAGVADTFPFAL